jgi:3'-phosphoadenosine 5'-phosphosulfate sulfotransferase
VRDIPLLGQAVSLAANRDQGGYQVELQSSDGRDPEAALAISSEKWADASWMLLLLRLLQKDCAADTALRPVP